MIDIPTSETNEGPKCARCGGPLTDGYVMAPKGLWWDKKPHLLTQYGGENEKIIGMFSLTLPKAPAQRCYSCNIVIIQVQE